MVIFTINAAILAYFLEFFNASGLSILRLLYNEF